jgi:hypothetical protein
LSFFKHEEKFVCFHLTARSGGAAAVAGFDPRRGICYPRPCKVNSGTVHVLGSDLSFQIPPNRRAAVAVKQRGTNAQGPVPSPPVAAWQAFSCFKHTAACRVPYLLDGKEIGLASSSVLLCKRVYLLASLRALPAVFHAMYFIFPLSVRSVIFFQSRVLSRPGAIFVQPSVYSVGEDPGLYM